MSKEDKGQKPGKKSKKKCSHSEGFVYGYCKICLRYVAPCDICYKYPDECKCAEEDINQNKEKKQ